MSIVEMANKIDDLQTKSQMVDSLQWALYIAIFRQDKAAKTDFEWAFTLLGHMTGEMAKELGALTECVFEQCRAEG